MTEAQQQQILEWLKQCPVSVKSVDVYEATQAVSIYLSTKN